MTKLDKRFPKLVAEALADELPHPVTPTSIKSIEGKMFTLSAHRDRFTLHHQKLGTLDFHYGKDSGGTYWSGAVAELRDGKDLDRWAKQFLEEMWSNEKADLIEARKDQMLRKGTAVTMGAGKNKLTGKVVRDEGWTVYVRFEGSSNGAINVEPGMLKVIPNNDATGGKDVDRHVQREQNKVDNGKPTAKPTKGKVVAKSPVEQVADTIDKGKAKKAKKAKSEASMPKKRWTNLTTMEELFNEGPVDLGAVIKALRNQQRAGATSLRVNAGMETINVQVR